jgi:diguanylate cyclase (GGDEF)-like protein
MPHGSINRSAGVGRNSYNVAARHDVARYNVGHDIARHDVARHDVARYNVGHNVARHDVARYNVRHPYNVAVRHDVARYDVRHPYNVAARHDVARYDVRHPYNVAARHDVARYDVRHPYRHYRNTFYVPYVNTYFPVATGVVYIDPLTQVYTLPAFQTYTNYILNNNVYSTTYLILIDIHGLLDINQTYGRDAGDNTLKSVSKSIKETADPLPVARVGDDMFAIIVNDLSYDQINDLITEINDKITTTPVDGDNGIIISPSTGNPLYAKVTIGIFKKTESESLDDLLARGERSMRDYSGNIFMTQY